MSLHPQALCDGLSVLELNAGKPAVVLFHPQRNVAGHTVLPTAEPQKDQSEVMAAGVLNEAVNQGEIEYAFFRFDELPGDGS